MSKEYKKYKEEIKLLCQKKTEELTTKDCQTFMDNHNSSPWRNKLKKERLGQYFFNVLFNNINISFPELFYSINESYVQDIVNELYFQILDKQEN